MTPFLKREQYHGMKMTSKTKKIEQPTEERRARGRMGKKIVDMPTGQVEVYQMMDLLDLLLSRKQISDDQYRVGLTFYRDWYYSGLAGAGAIDYSKIKVDMSGVPNVSFRSMAALTRWQRAVKILGRTHCQPLNQMILLEQTPEEYGQRLGQQNPKLARLVAITLLKNSLDALIEHYDFGKEDMNRAKRRPPHPNRAKRT